jgi:hypothetical protein
LQKSRRKYQPEIIRNGAWSGCNCSALGVRWFPRNAWRSLGKEPAYALTIRAKQPESKAGAEIWAEVAFKNISDHDLEIRRPIGKLGFGRARRVLLRVGRPETELGRAMGKGEALYAGSAWDACFTI